MKKLMFVLLATAGLLFTSCTSDLTVDPAQDNVVSTQDNSDVKSKRSKGSTSCGC